MTAYEFNVRFKIASIVVIAPNQADVSAYIAVTDNLPENTPDPANTFTTHTPNGRLDLTFDNPEVFNQLSVGDEIVAVMQLNMQS